MAKGNNRRGSQASWLAKALGAAGSSRDRGGRNIGVRSEHSRIPKGSNTKGKSGGKKY
jgi:hypothetical protein